VVNKGWCRKKELGGGGGGGVVCGKEKFVMSGRGGNI